MVKKKTKKKESLEKDLILDYGDPQESEKDPNNIFFLKGKKIKVGDVVKIRHKNTIFRKGWYVGEFDFPTKFAYFMGYDFILRLNYYSDLYESFKEKNVLEVKIYGERKGVKKKK